MDCNKYRCFMSASWKSQSKTFGRYTNHKGIQAHHYSKSLNNKGREQEWPKETEELQNSQKNKDLNDRSRSICVDNFQFEWTGPGWVSHLARSSSWYSKAAGSVLDRGTYEKQPVTVWVSETTNHWCMSLSLFLLLLLLSLKWINKHK